MPRAGLSFLLDRGKLREEMMKPVLQGTRREKKEKRKHKTPSLDKVEFRKMDLLVRIT